MSLPAEALVVGLGTLDRGDDAVGPVIAAQVSDALTAPALGAASSPRVVTHEDPTALLDLLAGTADRPVSTVVVVDAVQSARAAGTVVVLDVGPGGADAKMLAQDVDPGPAGTHGFGLAGAIELARALERLPPHVVVVGVVGARFDHGAAMSDAVIAALPQATDRVLALLEQQPERS